MQYDFCVHNARLYRLCLKFVTRGIFAIWNVFEYVFLNGVVTDSKLDIQNAYGQVVVNGVDNGRIFYGCMF